MMRCSMCGSKRALYFVVSKAFIEDVSFTCAKCEASWLNSRRQLNPKYAPSSEYDYFDTYEALQLELIKRKL